MNVNWVATVSALAALLTGGVAQAQFCAQDDHYYCGAILDGCCRVGTICGSGSNGCPADFCCGRADAGPRGGGGTMSGSSADDSEFTVCSVGAVGQKSTTSESLFILLVLALVGLRRRRRLLGASAILALCFLAEPAAAQRCGQDDEGFGCSAPQTFSLRHTLSGGSGSQQYSFPIRVQAELTFDSFMGDVRTTVRYNWTPDGPFVLGGRSFDFVSLPANVQELLKLTIDVRGFLRGTHGETTTPPIGEHAISGPAGSWISHWRHQDPDDAIEGHSEESARQYFRDGFVVQRLEVVDGDPFGLYRLASALPERGEAPPNTNGTQNGNSRIVVTDASGNETIMETAASPTVQLRIGAPRTATPTPTPTRRPPRPRAAEPQRASEPVARPRPERSSRATEAESREELAKRIEQERLRRQEETDRTRRAISAPINAVTSMPTRDLHSGEFRFLLGIGSITGVHSLDNGATGISTGGLLMMHGNIMGLSGFGLDGELTVGVGFSLDSGGIILGTRALLGTRYNNWVAARVGLDVSIGAAELDGASYSRRTVTFPMGIALTPVYQNDFVIEFAGYWQAGGFALSGELAIESFLFRYDYRSYRTHAVHWMSIAYRPV